MNYPKEMQIGGHVIPVKYFNDFVYQIKECAKCGVIRAYEKEETHCKVCDSTLLIPEDSYVHGAYNPNLQVIKLANKDGKEDTMGMNLVHESIEAVNTIQDLQLNHTQITVLGEMLYQAFSTGKVDFTPSYAAAA